MPQERGRLEVVKWVDLKSSRDHRNLTQATVAESEIKYYQMLGFFSINQRLEAQSDVSTA